MSEAARLGLTETFWSRYRDGMNALVATAREVQADVSARHERVTVSAIRSLALRAAHGDELAAAIELASKPLDLVHRAARCERDPAIERAMDELAADFRAPRGQRGRRLVEMVQMRGGEIVTRDVEPSRAASAATRPLPSPVRPAGRGRARVIARGGRRRR